MKILQFLKIASLRLVNLSSLSGLVFFAGLGGVRAELPIVHPGLPWSNNVHITQQTENTLSIGQYQNRPGNWILNWQSFNVGADSSVIFDQPSSTHIALNRIYQNSASQILGSIDANGRIYLINQNGFLFGKQSSINVNSLVASTLALNSSDEDFISGNKNIANIINAAKVGEKAGAAFDIDAFKYKVDKDSGELVALDPGNGVALESNELGEIIIEKESITGDTGKSVEVKAEINAQEGGNILMFAADIVNGGELNTLSGQTILAASKDRVYLTPSTDPSLRGFLVEVDTGGSVENLGKILSRRGNISLAGFAINQNGELQATTTVSENGSIRLLARSGAQVVNSSNELRTRSETILGVDVELAKDEDGGFLVSDQYAVATQTGMVTLGKDSRLSISIEEIPDESTPQITDDVVSFTDVQEQIKSKVEITGREIRMQSGSSITAQGAGVILHATENAALTATDTSGALRSRDNSKIVLETDSRIDVSGSNAAQVAMERNELAVQLTGNVLRDNPLSRDNQALRNQDIYIDIREGTPLGDMSGAVAANIKRSANERLSSGGDISLISQGGVLTEESSQLDISAGSVNYQAGYITTSRLVTESDQLVDIAEADPGELYKGIFGLRVITDDRWGKNAERVWSLNPNGKVGVKKFHEAYIEGSDAGHLKIQAHGAILDHQLNASTINSELQREIAQRPEGGRFDLILSNPADLLPAQSVEISSNKTDLVYTLDLPDKESFLEDFLNSTANSPEWLLQLNNTQLANGEVSTVSIKTNGDISLSENMPLQLNDAGKLSLDGGRLDINSDIHIASGVVNIKAFKTLSVNSEIDVSGSWVNDRQVTSNRDLNRPVNLRGGEINLASEDGHLLLQNSNLRANAGAWLDSAGHLKYARGGSIKLAVKDFENNTAADIRLGNFEAYSATRGGSIDIKANRISIADNFLQPANPGEVQLSSDFFTEYGFSDFNLVSNTNNLSVYTGTVLQPATKNLVLDRGYNFKDSTGNFLDIAHIEKLPEHLTPKTNLNLSSNLDSQNVGVGEGLLIESGARIQLQAGSDLSLSSKNNLFMNGEIIAPGGHVSLTLKDGDQYDSRYAIWLAGSINTQGRLVESPTGDNGLLSGTLYDSGSVTLNAQRGYIVTQAGSMLNVSGATAELDVPAVTNNNTIVSYERKKVALDAGSINFIAAEGLLLNGDLLAQAAAIDGAGGGSLGIEIKPREFNGNQAEFTSQTRQINLLQSFTQQPSAPQANSSIDDSLIGQAWISVEKINQGGFDRLSLTSGTNSANSSGAASGVINFHDNIDLRLGQSLYLNAPILRGEGVVGSKVNLNAPYILIGNTSGRLDTNTLASSGNSQLNIQAGLDAQQGLLEFRGHNHLQGFNATNLGSVGDIRLRGSIVGIQNEPQGSLNSYSDLSIQADQLYASTLSQFEINVNGDPAGELKITSNPDSIHSPVLSAGSRLSLSAPSILQSGVIKAPFGQINLSASTQLALSADSITSVSGENQLVPFGGTLGEERWVYALDQGSRRIDIENAPSKEIILESPIIDLMADSLIDISGGGDLYGWEFVPGLGGSVDQLLAENANGAFAVLPENTAYAAYDHNYWLGEENIRMGDQVYLGESAGLAQGLYTVLPARYALLPGAFLVTPTEQQLLLGQQLVRQDGTNIVAGQQRIAGTELYDEQWSGYLVEEGATVRNRSEYFEVTASQFYRDDASRNDTALSAMPEDAGILNILAIDDLILKGNLNQNVAAVNYFEDGVEKTSSGRVSLVNISGDSISILPVDDGREGIVISAEDLNHYSDSSLFIGGTRSRTAEGTDVSVTANNILIADGVELNVNELVLASNNNITLQSGSSINAQGSNLNASETLIIDGDGALFRASSSEQVVLNRKNESDNPLQGKLIVEAGASITAEKSIVLDASQSHTLDGLINVNNGSLYLGAPGITISNSGDVASNALEVTGNDLVSFNANELVLGVRSSVDLYGALNLQFESLKIEAASLNGYQQLGENVSINANETLSLGNAANYTRVNEPVTGAGKLVLNAKNIGLLGGDFTLQGFNELQLTAAQDISVSGRGSFNTSLNGEITLDAARITAQRRADYLINAGASVLNTVNNQLPVSMAINQALGAKLTIQAETINHAGQIELASGDLLLNATGKLSGITLQDASIINLSGIKRDFYGEAVYTPGGNLSLQSDSGNVVMASAASVNVSGGENLGDAGSIEVIARQGSINIAGQLSAADNNNGGSFISDSMLIENILDLNQKLNTEFNQQRKVRLRNGNLEIAANDSIIAEDVLLQVDQGNINIAGEINASAENGGKVHLAVQNSAANLSDNILSFGGVIDASATGNNADGGMVYIESRGPGMIDLQSGSTINVAATGSGENGKIHLRVPRISNNTSFSLNMVNSTLAGFSDFTLEAYKSYDIAGSVNVSLLNNGGLYSSEANSFMNVVDLSNFALATHPLVDRIHINPGIELNSASDLTLSQKVDLLSVRFGANNDIPAILTLRSSNNLNIQNDLQDGFIEGVEAIPGFNFGPKYDQLQQTDSWSFNLVSGADLGAASVFSSTNNNGDLILGSNNKIRTGTGDISIASGGDINLLTDSAIYTAGKSTQRGSYDFQVDLGGGFFVNAFDLYLLPGIEYPLDGGNLDIFADGNLTVDSSSMLVTDWLHRLGTTLKGEDIGTTWGISFANFKHGVGALGGGDIDIKVKGDISGLSVSIPTTGKQIGENTFNLLGLDGTFTAVTDVIEVNGQGDIQIQSSGSIHETLLFAANGKISAFAKGDIGSGKTNEGLSLLLGDTQSNIYAGGDIYLQGINNSTFVPLSRVQATNMSSVSNSAQNYYNIFSTLAESSAVKMSSLNGDIEILNQFNTVNGSKYDNINNVGSAANGSTALRLGNYYPGQFEALATDGSINIVNNLTLSPSSEGRLSLMAQNNISALNEGRKISLTQIDVTPGSLPGVLTPVGAYKINNFPEDGSIHGSTLLHEGDSAVSRLVSNTGSIYSSNPLNPFILQTNMQTEVFAGKDILGLSLEAQNNNPGDISILEAGRDIKHINSVELNGSFKVVSQIRVNGPGEFHVLAGRDINLGDQKGITAYGNLLNPVLPDENAQLIVMSGLGEQGADYESFAGSYFVDGSVYADELIQTMDPQGSLNLSVGEALNLFIQLDEKQQRSLVLSAFSNELAESTRRAALEQDGRATNNQVLGYSMGFDAIGSLFAGSIIEKRQAKPGETSAGDKVVTGGFAYNIPANSEYFDGDISMVSSTIQSRGDEGDILLFTPGGGLNVGLSVASGSEGIEKGIITKGNGEITTYALDDISVNQSRIQALNTGRIIGWSSIGDVDAGKGERSALSIPPPRNFIDPETGAIVQVFDTAVQGSGIRAACIGVGCKEGDVLLAAPAGVINTGDAGIGGGNIIIAGEVIGTNIEASGETSGGATDAGALGADLGGLDVNSAGEEASAALVAQDVSDQLGEGSIAILQVEVMGLSTESDDAADGKSGSKNTRKQPHNKPSEVPLKQSNNTGTRKLPGADLSMNN